jgi:hypothetical protein
VRTSIALAMAGSSPILTSSDPVPGTATYGTMPRPIRPGALPSGKISIPWVTPMDPPPGSAISFGVACIARSPAPDQAGPAGVLKRSRHHLRGRARCSMDEHRKGEDSRAAHGVARWGQRRRGPGSLADRSGSSPRTSPMQDAIASREPLPFGRKSRMKPSRGASAERRANSVRMRPAPGLSTCGMPVFVAGESSAFAYAVNSQ